MARKSPTFASHRSGVGGVAALAIAALAAGSAMAQSLPDGTLVRYAGNPLLTKGPAGSYDQLKLGPRAILREAPTVWKMWYEAAQGGNQSTTAYATSTDGLTFYIFDVERAAVLLIGGDKTGDERFYDRMISIAERIWEQYKRERGSK